MHGQTCIQTTVGRAWAALPRQRPAHDILSSPGVPAPTQGVLPIYTPTPCPVEAKRH